MDNSQDKIPMHHDAKPKLFEYARKNREQNTEAEKILWEALRLKKLDGFKFRNQHPIGKYVVDFYCHSERLVIELDGEYHENQEQKEYDMGRSDDIGFSGVRILRFKNPEIQYNLEKVIETMRFYLKNKEQQLPTHTPDP